MSLVRIVKFISLELMEQLGPKSLVSEYSIVALEFI